MLQSSGQTLSYRKRRHLLKQRRQAQRAYQARLERSQIANSTRAVQRRRSAGGQPMRQVRPSQPIQPFTNRQQVLRRQAGPAAPQRTVQRAVTTQRVAPSQRQGVAQRRVSPQPQRPVAQRSRPKRRRARKKPILYPMRLLVTGLGVGAIAGTVLAIADPGPRSILTRSSEATSLEATDSETREATARTVAASVEPPIATSQHPQQQTLNALKTKIQSLAAKQEGLTPGVYFLNPETGAVLNIAGEQSFSAASTIKVPVLLAFFQAVDAGEINLDDMLVMRPDLIASEAGTMQYQEPGTQFSALETAEKMIIISDNTATNMLIDQLGGADRLNRQFQTWGLQQTAIRNPLPDLEGTNTISPKDLSSLMLKLSRGELLSIESRDHALKIMRRTVTKTLLPRGLAPDATIAHKTGDIGSIVGDTGLIEMPNGQRYVGTAMVERPHNDPRAQELIREISRLTYGVFREAQPDAAQSNQPD